jgi:hypothetical protein
VSEPRPLSECREEDLVRNHALVYGRVRVGHHMLLKDMNAVEWHWSAYAWWKAMWHPHRGAPCNSYAWGVYGGPDGHTGPGAAELTHFLPMPADPLEDTP